MLGRREIRGVICDLDGTLVDSAEDLRAALNVVMRRAGLRQIAPDEIRAMIGDGVPKLVERGLDAAGGDSGDAASLVPEFLTVYEANPTAHTRCYPGVVRTLAALKDRQCKLAVVTNKPAVAAQKILRQLSIADFFAAVVGGDSLPERKPHPAPLLEAARQLSLPTSDLLMVGDNIHDIEAARAAGIQSVAVTYGYHHRSPSSFGASHLINRFADLMSLIDMSTDVADNQSSGVVISFF
jgi:phosphoglycolate phosphatase